VVGATGTLTCSLGNLANGSVATTSVVVTIISPHKSTVTETASVSSTTYDPNMANNTATVTVLLK
jgi:hypothetical protein